MSDYICPQCKQPDVLEDMLFLDVSDERKLASVLSQEVYTHTCTHCGFQQLLLLQSLVYNSQKEYVILLKEKEDPRTPRQLLKHHCSFRAKEEERYLERIVIDPDALTEKVLMFEEGRDDRLLELVKVYTKARLSSEDPNLKIVNLFYCYTENGEEFAILTEEGFAGTVPLDVSLCIRLEDELERLPMDLSLETMIDEGWAMRAISAIQPKGGN